MGLKKCKARIAVLRGGRGVGRFALRPFTLLRGGGGGVDEVSMVVVGEKGPLSDKRRHLRLTGVITPFQLRRSNETRSRKEFGWIYVCSALISMHPAFPSRERPPFGIDHRHAS
jgi:hypothetical protein